MRASVGEKCNFMTSKIKMYTFAGKLTNKVRLEYKIESLVDGRNSYFQYGSCQLSFSVEGEEITT